MSPPASCRVLIEPHPGTGPWNMAVDEVLLEAARDGCCTLRFYRWREATLSLGYFQAGPAAAGFPALSALPVVRRLSGGGAILHHHEWTYSCAVPPTHALARSPQQLYEQVHAGFMAVLARRGVTTHLRRETDEGRKHAFLCFGRGDPHDLVLEGHKVLGSAQRRRRGAVLQHGSLLLKRSPHADAFPGILDLAPESVLDKNTVEELAADLVARLGCRFVRGELETGQRKRTRQLEAERYRTIEWGRQRPASVPS